MKFCLVKCMLTPMLCTSEGQANWGKISDSPGISVPIVWCVVISCAYIHVTFSKSYHFLKKRCLCMLFFTLFDKYM